MQGIHPPDSSLPFPISTFRLSINIKLSNYIKNLTASPQPQDCRLGPEGRRLSLELTTVSHLGPTACFPQSSLTVLSKHKSHIVSSAQYSPGARGPSEHTRALLDLSPSPSPAPPPEATPATSAFFLSLEDTTAVAPSQGFPVTVLSAWVTHSPDTFPVAWSFLESVPV